MSKILIREHCYLGGQDIIDIRSNFNPKGSFPVCIQITFVKQSLCLKKIAETDTQITKHTRSYPTWEKFKNFSSARISIAVILKD